MNELQILNFFLKFPKELRFGIADFKVNSRLSVRNFQKILGKIVMKSLPQGLACSKHALLIIVTWRLAFHLDTSLQPISVLIKNSLREYKGYAFFLLLCLITFLHIPFYLSHIVKSFKRKLLKFPSCHYIPSSILWHFIPHLSGLPCISDSCLKISQKFD